MRPILKGALTALTSHLACPSPDKKVQQDARPAQWSFSTDAAAANTFLIL
jgi:hypothetical protein